MLVFAMPALLPLCWPHSVTPHTSHTLAISGRCRASGRARLLVFGAVDDVVLRVVEAVIWVGGGEIARERE